MQIERISEVPSKSESRGLCVSGDNMVRKLAGQRPRPWKRDKSGEGKKERGKKSESDCEDESGFFSSKKETGAPTGMGRQTGLMPKEKVRGNVSISQVALPRKCVNKHAAKLH